MNFLSDLAPYKRGAFDMFSRLKELFVDEPIKQGEQVVYDRAIFDLLSDEQARERFLKHDFEQIGFRNHVRKGKKLISCEACFLVWDSKNGWHEGSLKNER
jgi:hypothetical protein